MYSIILWGVSGYLALSVITVYRLIATDLRRLGFFEIVIMTLLLIFLVCFFLPRY